MSDLLKSLLQQGIANRERSIKAKEEAEKRYNEEFATDFTKLNSLNDLLDLLNKIDKVWNKKEAREIELRTLNYYLFSKKDNYYQFTIPKKSGALRTIKSPDKFLKSVQRRINFCLNLLFTPKSAANGFVKERSIITNASYHTNKKYVLNLDLEDFFNTITFGRVKSVLKLSPFNLGEDAAHLVANLCCDNGTLPQGAPTSPTLTNIVCQRLDRKLVQLIKTNNGFYTRYADDLTFSSNKNIFNEKFIEDIKKNIMEEGFRLNDKKQRLQHKHQRQEVTGIVVNEGVNIKRNYLKEIRAILHSWETLGHEYAKNKYFEKYNLSQETDFDTIILGKIHFIGFVKGKENKTYLNFIEKFKKLNNQIEPTSYEEIVDDLNSKIRNLLSILENEKS